MNQMNYHEDTVHSAGIPSFFTPVKFLQDLNIVSRGLRLGILLGAAEPFLKSVKNHTRHQSYTTNINTLHARPLRLAKSSGHISRLPSGHPGAVRMAMPGTEMLQLTERFSVPNLDLGAVRCSQLAKCISIIVNPS